MGGGALFRNRFVKHALLGFFSLKFGGAEGGLWFSSEGAWPGNVTTGEP